MRRLIAALAGLLLLAPQAARAEGSTVVSGIYDGRMLIGFDPATQIVTGYFSANTGRGQFSCMFYLKGTLQGSAVLLSTYFPATPVDDLIKGQMLLTSRGSFQVRLPSEHGGCWNVEHFADDQQPALFRRDAAYPWISVAVVRHDKAYLYDTPTSATHRKVYVAKGDGVGVRAAKAGWLQIDFVSAGKLISGWIKQADIYPAD